MASTYTDNIKLDKQGVGDNINTWGTVLNTNVIDLVDEAVSGTVSIAITGNTSLTISNGATSNVRHKVLTFTGTLAANALITVPAIQKTWIIFNNTSGGFSLNVAPFGGTTVTVPAGETREIYSDGTNCFKSLSSLMDRDGDTRVEVERTTDVDTIHLRAGGTTVLDATATEVTVNNGAADVDFRVESTGNANALFVDAGNSRVGVNQASPAVPLHVKGAAGTSNSIIAETIAANASGVTNHFRLRGSSLNTAGDGHRMDMEFSSDTARVAISGTLVTSTTGSLNFLTHDGSSLAIRGYVRNGLVMGSAGGGDQGAGTVNATALYVNGVAVSTASTTAYGTWMDPAIFSRGHIYGLKLSNNGSDANNDIDIAAGSCTSTTSPRRSMALHTTITKQLDAAWAIGTNAGGIDTGAEANSTWYHVHLIGRHDLAVTNRARTSNVATLTITSHGLAVGQTVLVRSVGSGYDGLAVIASVPTSNTFTYANTGSAEGSTAASGFVDAFDALFSASATSPTMPSGWTTSRRIGSIRNNGSGNILAFVQHGDHFWLGTPVSDLNTSNPGTSAVLRTLTVPSGVKVIPISSYHVSDEDASVSPQLLVTGPDQADTTPSVSLSSANAYTAVTPAFSDSAHHPVLTDTSSRVRTRFSASSADTHLRITTHGWIDARGKED